MINVSSTYLLNFNLFTKFNFKKFFERHLLRSYDGIHSVFSRKVPAWPLIKGLTFSLGGGMSFCVPVLPGSISRHLLGSTFLWR